MNKFCKKCALDPDSHSFKKVGEKNGVSIYYTKPSAGKLYKDTQGIIEHIDNTLAANNAHKKSWICIFDGDGFDVQHATEFDTGRAIIELIIAKYYNTLTDVKVINPTWHINGCMKFGELFMTQEMFNKIKILEDRRYSILEFI